MFFEKKNKLSQQKQRINTQSWSNDRYDVIIVQRNVALLLVFICLIVILASIFALVKISLSKKIDPFVIQIDQKTGATKVVNPVDIEVLDSKEALAQYFIQMYIGARETYNSADFEGRSRRIIQLLSSRDVYWTYIGFISHKENDPRVIYGQTETTTFKIRSWSQLHKNSFMVRIAIKETVSGKVFNKVIIINYDYVPMELSNEDLNINPVGFQVTGYSISDDYS